MLRTCYLLSRPGPTTCAARPSECSLHRLLFTTHFHGSALQPNQFQAMPKTPIPVLSDEEIKAAATFVVKRFRKFHKRSTESQTQTQQSQSLSSSAAPLLRATAKAPGLPVPPHCNPDLPLRISDPPIALARQRRRQACSPYATHCIGWSSAATAAIQRRLRAASHRRRAMPTASSDTAQPSLARPCITGTAVH